MGYERPYDFYDGMASDISRRISVQGFDFIIQSPEGGAINYVGINAWHCVFRGFEHDSFAAEARMVPSSPLHAV